MINQIKFLNFILHYLNLKITTRLAFRHKRVKGMQVKGLFDLKSLSFGKAIKEYEKLKYISSYGAFYGRKPALADLTDTHVLNSQKFSQLQCFSVINEATKSCLDSWQKIEQEDEYKGFAISAIRSLYTFIKNGQPNNSTMRVSFKNFKPTELVAVERYDKLIEEVSMNVKKQFFRPKINQFFEK